MKVSTSGCSRKIVYSAEIHTSPVFDPRYLQSFQRNASVHIQSLLLAGNFRIMAKSSQGLARGRVKILKCLNKTYFFLDTLYRKAQRQGNNWLWTPSSVLNRLVLAFTPLLSLILIINYFESIIFFLSSLSSIFYPSWF